MTSAQTEVVNMENKTAIYCRTKDFTTLLDEHAIYVDVLSDDLKDFLNKFYRVYLKRKPRLKDIYDIICDARLYEFLNAIELSPAVFALSCYDYVKRTGSLDMHEIDLVDYPDDNTVFNNVIPLIKDALRVFYE